jgi:hypothetical protein
MDTNAATFACFGIESLGQCSYNPASPSNLYFSLGEVVGALAFTLAAQQLLKQVVIFRLSARYIPLNCVYLLVFAGVLAATIAAIVPNLPFLHRSPFGFAINWEILATALFVSAYATVVLALVVPVSVKPNRIEDFARGAVRLLSSAEETDQVDFTLDLQRSLPLLIQAAAFGAHVRSATAFYDFRYRSEIRAAAYARSFLTIISDPTYCRTLIIRQPWRVAEILRQISKDELYCRQAEQFVRELAHQAIIRDDSMMTREVGYYGFSRAPLLSEALFSDYFIVRRYNPLDSFFTASSEQITPMLLKRFNSAAERCYITLIDNQDFVEAQAAFSIQSYYRSVFMRADLYQADKAIGFHIPLEMSRAVEMAARLANRPHGHSQR